MRATIIYGGTKYMQEKALKELLKSYPVKKIKVIKSRFLYAQPQGEKNNHPQVFVFKNVYRNNNKDLYEISNFVKISRVSMETKSGDIFYVKRPHGVFVIDPRNQGELESANIDFTKFRIIDCRTKEKEHNADVIEVVEKEILGYSCIGTSNGNDENRVTSEDNPNTSELVGYISNVFQSLDKILENSNTAESQFFKGIYTSFKEREISTLKGQMDFLESEKIELEDILKTIDDKVEVLLRERGRSNDIILIIDDKIKLIAGLIKSLES